MANTDKILTGLAAATASMQELNIAAKEEAHDDATAIEEKLAILTGTAARGPSPAEQKQTDEDTTNTGNKTNTILMKIGSGITGLWEMGKKSAAMALKGLGAGLLGIALGAALYGIGEFLQSETFKKLLKYLKEVVMPGLEKFWNFLVDNWEVVAGGIAALLVAMGIIKAAIIIAKFVEIANKIATAFKAVQVFMMDTMLPKVKAMIGGVVGKFASWAGKIKNAFIAVQVFMIDTMLPKVKAMIGGVVGKFASIAGKIAVAFTAVTTFMTATMLPAVTAFMVPLLPFIAIAALIGVALYALWNAFEDFQTTLDETGSIGEALKVGIAKFMGTILGFIPALILKLVGWVAGLFGFDDFKEKVDAINPIQWISDTIKGMFDAMAIWFGTLFNFSSIESTLASVINVLTFIPNIVKDAIVGVTTWLMGLFGFDDAAKKLANAADWSFGSIIAKAITSVVEWIESIFNIDLAALTSKLGDKLNPLNWFSGDKTEKRAGGGPISADKPYLVGEQGPELILPSSSGQVLNADKTASIAGYEKDRLTREATASAGGGGGSVTSMINAPTTSNVTTTGNSGQVSLQNNKFANLNAA